MLLPLQFLVTVDPQAPSRLLLQSKDELRTYALQVRCGRRGLGVG